MLLCLMLVVVQSSLISSAHNTALEESWFDVCKKIHQLGPRHRPHLGTSLILAGTPPSAKLWSASPGCVHPTLGL